MRFETPFQDADLSRWLQPIAARFIEAGALPPVLDELLRAAVAMTHADFGFLKLHNPHNGLLHLAASVGTDLVMREAAGGGETAAFAEDSACAAALREGSRIVIEDLARFAAADHHVRRLMPEVGALQCTPLRATDGAIVGILATACTHGRHFDPHDLTRLDALLAHTSAVITSAQAAWLLVERETHYRLLFHSIGDGAAYCRVRYDASGQASDWQFLDANESLRELLGVSDLIGKSARELWPGLFDAAPEVLALLGCVERGGTGEGLEFYWPRVERWVHVSASRPEPAHAILIVKDVSARKCREANQARAKRLSDALNRINMTLHATLNFQEIATHLLRESATALECDSAAILTRTLDGWRVLDSYGMAGHLIGKPLSQEEAQHIWLAQQSRKILAIEDSSGDTRVHPDYLKHHPVGAMLAAPLIARNKALGVMAFQFQGGPRPISDAEKQFAQQLSITAAIALDNANLFQEHLRVEKALQASEQRLHLALDGGELGLWDWDLRSDQVIWNARHYALFGLTPERFHNRAAEAIAVIHPEDRAMLRRAIDQTLHHHTPFSVEFRVVHSDESVHWLHSKGQLVRGATEDQLRLIGVCYDISEQKQAELERRHYLRQEDLAQTHRLTLAGEFAALLAHQLNQPLAAIRSFAEAAQTRLRRGSSDQERMLASLGDIVTQSERAAQSIRDLRRFLARQPQDRRPSDINTLVQAACDLMRLLAESHGIRLLLELARELPKTLTRPAQIEQVLIILIDNAIDAIGAQAITPGPTIRVSTEEGADDGTVIVGVMDTGPGLSRESVERVFDPLFTTKPGGIGMGLTIARSIIEDHGGRIWAEAGPSGCFKFTLPAARA